MQGIGIKIVIDLALRGVCLCYSWGWDYLDNDFMLFFLFMPKDTVASSARLYKKTKRELCSIYLDNSLGTGDISVYHKIVARLCRNYHQGITEEGW